MNGKTYLNNLYMYIFCRAIMMGGIVFAGTSMFLNINQFIAVFILLAGIFGWYTFRKKYKAMPGNQGEILEKEG